MASKTRGPLDKQNRTPRFYRKAGHVLQQLSNGIDLRSSISSLNFKEVVSIFVFVQISCELQFT